MASRSSRYDPRYDDPPLNRRAYPDPYSGIDKNDYEYVGTDELPDPPSHTFEEPPRRSSPSRRSSPPRRKRQSRASTLPPQSSRRSPPPRSRRGASPPARSSRHSDSPPRRSRHYNSPPPTRSSRRGDSPPRSQTTSSKSSKRDRYNQFMEKPAVKNMKSYGRKGLTTVGDFVDAYAAAQAPPEDGRSMEREGPVGGFYPGRHNDKHNYYLDRNHRPHRRGRSPTPSMSPSPERRGSARHSRRERPRMHGRQKSYSESPPPLSRDPDDYDRGRNHRRDRRRSYSTSPSVSPRSRRHRTQPSHYSGTSRATSRGHGSSKKPVNPEIASRWQMAARAALEAGGVTAFRLRKEPGSWTGDKGAKIATAALGAAAIDAFIDKDPRRQRTGGMKGMAENAISGLLASKLMGVKPNPPRMGRGRF